MAVVVAQSLGESSGRPRSHRGRLRTTSVVVDSEKAMAQGAPLLYDDVPNNIALHWKAGGGDIQKAFREAEVTIKQRVVNQRLLPTAMETRGATAEYDIGSGS